MIRSQKAWHILIIYNMLEHYSRDTTGKNKFKCVPTIHKNLWTIPNKYMHVDCVRTNDSRIFSWNAQGLLAHGACTWCLGHFQRSPPQREKTVTALIPAQPAYIYVLRVCMYVCMYVCEACRWCSGHFQRSPPQREKTVTALIPAQPAYIRACMYTSIHTYIHTCIHAWMHACIYTYIHSWNTWIHTYIHATQDSYWPLISSCDILQTYIQAHAYILQTHIQAHAYILQTHIYKHMLTSCKQIHKHMLTSCKQIYKHMLTSCKYIYTHMLPRLWWFTSHLCVQNYAISHNILLLVNMTTAPHAHDISADISNTYKHMKPQH